MPIVLLGFHRFFFFFFFLIHDTTTQLTNLQHFLLLFSLLPMLCPLFINQSILEGVYVKARTSWALGLGLKSSLMVAPWLSLMVGLPQWFILWKLKLEIPIR